MENGGVSPKPYVTPEPGLLTRVFFRLPVYFYRLHLGWLVGRRILCLRHTGRKTGRVRTNCIEVIHADRGRREYTVISAYGRRSDWFRNIMKNPPLELQIGRERFVPEFRILSPSEARQVLKEAFSEHPGEVKFFLKNVFKLDPSADQFEGLADLVPLVAFKPREPG